MMDNVMQIIGSRVYYAGRWFSAEEFDALVYAYRARLVAEDAEPDCRLELLIERWIVLNDGHAQ
jgi:hypothetical protein